MGKITRRSNHRHWLLLGVCLLMLYVVVPQLSDFHSSWGLLRHPQPAWALAAIGLACMTYLAAAGTYYFLAFKPLKYGQLVLIEVAAMFVNRLVPAGIGALGTNYSYLRRRNHSPAQSATMVAANNVIGVLGHLIIITVALIASAEQIKIHHFWQNWPAGRIAMAILISSVVVAFLWFKLGRRRITKTLTSFRKPLLSYGRHPIKLLGALLTSMSLTLCNVLCLLACAHALGVGVPFVTVLLIFSLGVGAATVTPTPGGLGGFEAGLFAGFVAYGVASPTALAIALLYRLISYWLPLVLGALSFIVAQRRHLLSA